MTVPAVVTLTNGTSAWGNQVATDVNNLLASVAALTSIAGVPRYATTAARDAAIPIPAQGNLVYVIAGDDYWYYTGAAWANFMDHPDLISRYAPLIREVAYAEVSVAQNAFGPAVTDITNATVTFVALAGHKYEIVGSAELSTNAAAVDPINLFLTDSANTIIQSRRHAINAGSYGSFLVMRRVIPGAGSITYKLRASATTGPINAQDAANNITVLRVHDMGT